ncbi:MAG: peptidase domain-containing ABC transporter [Bacteroidaceae bacterium]|nr:peptidase domain-containing ABC transporter [Bacteroidaceae bacterium]
MFDKGIKIKQQDITDCGAACLSSICAYYGLKYPIAKIRQHAFTNIKGTNIWGIINAAEKVGLSAKGVKANENTLRILPLPIIAHIIVNNKLLHFVVIYKVNDNFVETMDPADGKMHKISMSDFCKMWTGVLIIIEKSKSFKKGDVRKEHILYSIINTHKWALTKILLSAIVCSILSLSTSIYAGRIIDEISTNQNISFIITMSIIMVIMMIARIFISEFKCHLVLKTSKIIDKALILGYYNHLLKLPQIFFDTMRIGEIMSRINDAIKIRTFINNVFINIIVSSLVLSFSIGIMFMYSYELSLITLISIPVFVYIFWKYNNINKTFQKKIMETNAELESQMVESISSILLIKEFNAEKYTTKLTENKLQQVLDNIYKSSKYSIHTTSATNFLSSFVIIAILYIGSSFVIKEKISIGTLIVFFSLTEIILSPLETIINSNKSIQEAIIASNRLFQIMELETNENKRKENVLTKDEIGDIIFDNVSFRYGANKLLFNNINLRITKGRKTAIVGESGSGKTTLVSLIQNIYNIQDGHIYIGNYDVTTISDECLKDIIGIIPQKVQLFSGTILSNIAFGDDKPNINKVLETINNLGMSDFIKDLPYGIDTQIGENGITLSGGERQKISIARALYRNPEIIIFDEATSSLDSNSELFVRNTIDALAISGKTVIIIAHRLSTIKDVDSIIVVKKGKIIENGNFEELIKRKGEFYQLCKNQISDFIIN